MDRVSKMRPQFGSRSRISNQAHQVGSQKEFAMAARSYDIITIGGGIAASSLAKAMAERGAKVLVLERETKFKDRVRGEAIVSWAWPKRMNSELATC